MKSARRGRLRGFLPASPAQVVSGALLLAAFVAPMRPRPDPDTWWHLATGRWIDRFDRIPTEDPFSWTAAGKEWVAHEWLTDLGFYWLDRAFGPAALLVMVGLVVGVSFLVLARCLHRLTDNEWVVAAGLGCAFYLSTTMWTVRPWIVSLLFICIFTDTLLARRLHQRGLALWVLIPLTFLWANLHAGFISGVGLVCLAAVVRVVETKSLRLPEVAIALGCIGAGAINPHGFEIYPFAPYLARVSADVAEWQPVSIRTAYGFVFTLTGIGTLVGLALLRRKPDAFVVVAAAIFILMGLGAIRNIWIAGLFIAIAGVQALDLSKRVPAPSAVDSRFARGMLVGLMLLLAVLGGAYATRLSGRSDSYLRGEGPFPARAAAALEDLPQGRMVNPYNWGGYLIWRLPERPVSIDGRADMYGDRILNEAFEFERLSPGWREHLDDNDVAYVLMQAEARVTQALYLLPEWDVVYRDDEAVLFRRHLG